MCTFWWVLRAAAIRMVRMLCARVRVRAHVCMCVCTCVHTSVCMCVCTCVHTSVCMCVYACAHVQVTFGRRGLAGSSYSIGIYIYTCICT